MTGKNEVDHLREEIAQLGRAQLIAQAVVLACCGLVLSAQPVDRQRRVLAVLREGSTPLLRGILGSTDDPSAMLLADEVFAQLVDNLERLAESYRGIEGR